MPPPPRKAPSWEQRAKAGEWNLGDMRLIEVAGIEDVPKGLLQRVIGYDAAGDPLWEPCVTDEGASRALLSILRARV